MISGDFGVGELLWTFLWFFLFFMWISMVIYIFGDIIRDKETKGAAKAFWTLFIIILPYLGVLVYLIARGNGMAERSVRTAKAQDDAFREYVQSAAGGSAQQLATLADLLDRGKITQAEYDNMKKQIVQA